MKIAARSWKWRAPLLLSLFCWCSPLLWSDLIEAPPGLENSLTTLLNNWQRRTELLQNLKILFGEQEAALRAQELKLADLQESFSEQSAHLQASEAALARSRQSETQLLAERDQLMTAQSQLTGELMSLQTSLDELQHNSQQIENELRQSLQQRETSLQRLTQTEQGLRLSLDDSLNQLGLATEQLTSLQTSLGETEKSLEQLRNSTVWTLILTGSGGVAVGVLATLLVSALVGT